MKNYEEVARDVLARRDQYEENRRARKQQIQRALLLVLPVLLILEIPVLAVVFSQIEAARNSIGVTEGSSIAGWQEFEDDSTLVASMVTNNSFCFFVELDDMEEEYVQDTAALEDHLFLWCSDLTSYSHTAELVTYDSADKTALVRFDVYADVTALDKLNARLYLRNRNALTSLASFEIPLAKGETLSFGMEIPMTDETGTCSGTVTGVELGTQYLRVSYAAQAFETTDYAKGAARFDGNTWSLEDSTNERWQSWADGYHDCIRSMIADAFEDAVLVCKDGTEIRVGDMPLQLDFWARGQSVWKLDLTEADVYCYFAKVLDLKQIEAIRIDGVTYTVDGGM